MPSLIIVVISKWRIIKSEADRVEPQEDRTSRVSYCPVDTSPESIEQRSNQEFAKLWEGNVIRLSERVGQHLSDLVHGMAAHSHHGCLSASDIKLLIRGHRR
jgi:hypothetical protein